MANPFKFGTGIDLDQNELFRAVLQKSTSLTRPATPVLGQLTYDTDDDTIYTWDGVSAWAAVGSAAPDATTLIKGIVKLAQDLGGTADLPTVEYVGGATAAAVASATSASHTQGTDTGTTSQAFQLQSGSSGAKLKNVSGEVQLRNAADDGYADLRVKNLNVTGTQTIIDSNEVNIGDAVIELNSDVLVSTSNSDGGFEIRRLKTDAAGTGTISGSALVITGTTTAFQTEASVGDMIVFGAQRRKIVSITSDTVLGVDTAFSPQPTDEAFTLANQANAKIYFDNSTGTWKVTEGAVTAPQTLPLTRKVVAPLGNVGGDLVFPITHNLGSRDLSVTIRQTASPYAMILADVEFTSTSVVTVSFASAPSNHEYDCTIIG